jgi:hypothetical protein
VVGALASLKDLPKKGWERLQEEFKSKLVFEERGDHLIGLGYYISEKLDSKRHRQVMLQGQMSLSPGTYFGGFFRKTPFWVTFEREKLESPGWGGNPFRDIYTITFLTRKVALLKDFLAECKRLYDENTKESKVEVWFSSREGQYDDSLYVTPREIDSVILEKGLLEEILEDMERFKGAREWYQGTGVPYRRGYMLHGMPGNGKSSLVLALACHFKEALSVINLSSLTTDDAVIKAFSRSEGILLVEDADCVTREGFSSFSLSTLLNAIDGVGASDSRILFLTTNRPEMLDGALVRPGRLDRKFEIKNATNEQAGRLYQRFFGSLQGFKPVLDYMYSMAELQEMYLEKLDLKNLPTDKEKDEKEAVRRSRIRRFKLEEEGSY